MERLEISFGFSYVGAVMLALLLPPMLSRRGISPRGMIPVEKIKENNP
ncbi:MAG: hypothetical protein HFF06_04965 [Oscillospiraceae bacterium]|nr:hypothetical protein [Oscillospiraceae bacterium]